MELEFYWKVNAAKCCAARCWSQLLRIPTSSLQGCPWREQAAKLTFRPDDVSTSDGRHVAHQLMRQVSECFRWVLAIEIRLSSPVADKAALLAFSILSHAAALASEAVSVEIQVDENVAAAQFADRKQFQL